MERLRFTVLVVCLVIASVVVGSFPANADVTINTRSIQAGITITNPCDPSEGNIALTVEGHEVQRVMPDGSVIQHYNFHGTGVSATGTEYVINQTQVRLIDGVNFVAELNIRRISKGATPNAMIDREIVGPPSHDTRFVVTCVG